MKQISIIIMFVLLAITSYGQRYGIAVDPLCWVISGQDSSIVRVVQVSTTASAARIITYVNAEGNTVNVIGGTLYMGYCEDCEQLPPSSGDITASALIESQSLPIANPFNPSACGSTTIASTEGVASKSEITITLDGIALNDVDYTFNATTGMIQATHNTTTGTGIHTVVVSINTPYGSDSDTATFNCGG